MQDLTNFDYLSDRSDPSQKEQNQNRLFCRDCKNSFRTWRSWRRAGFSRESLLCRRSETRTENVDLITGRVTVTVDYATCVSARESRWRDFCGERAQYWIPRHRKDLFKLMQRDNAVDKTK